MSLSSSPRSQILAAFYDNRREADRAIDRIVEEGVPRADITIVEGADASGEKHRKGFFERLGELFIPQDDRETYAEGLSRGGYLVSVPVQDANQDRVRDILDDAGTVDLATRAQGWRLEGWLGSRTAQEAQRAGGTTASAATQRTDRSALFERAPTSGPSGTGRDAPAADRIRRSGDNPSTTRTRSYIYDDTSAAELVQRQEEEALGYGGTAPQGADDRTAVELDDQRRTETEKRRSGERD